MIRLNPGTLTILAILGLAIVVYVALEFAFPVALEKSVLLDFDIFHLVARMIAEGNLAAAYNADNLLDRQQELSGFNGSTLFWSYPPPFSMVVAPLGWMPVWLSYALFMLVTLFAYIYVLKKLAGSDFHTVLVLFLPSTGLILRAGQNGFLTGSLIGLTCLLALRRSGWSGFPLGLMAIKPHLAIGVGIWAILDRRWGLVLLSLATVAGFSAIATLVFGTDVWGQALDSVAASGDVLRDGDFPLFRMTSVYAFAVTLGLDHGPAMFVHFSVAIAGLGVLVILSHAKVSARNFMGAGVLVSAMLSPYNYDYDLAMLAFAACLLIATVRRHTSPPEKAIIMVTTLMIGSYGLAATLAIKAGILQDADSAVSVMAPLLVAVGVIVFRAIRRDGAEI